MKFLCHATGLVSASAAQAHSPGGTDCIKSLQNSTVKHCVKLLKKKSYREETGKCILAGTRVVEELGPHVDVACLFYQPDILSVSDNDAARIHDLIESEMSMAVSSGVMGKITGLETVSPTMVAAEVHMPRMADFMSWEPGTVTRLLVLECCQDPGNLGTLLRSAVAFGFDGVFLLPGCADPFNDKSIRASRGACFRIPLSSGSVEEWQGVCRHHELVPLVADINGKEQRGVIADPSLLQGGVSIDRIGSRRVSLAVGSEGQGVSDTMRDACIPIEIPMEDDMESLNVAAAASIIMCALSPAGLHIFHTIDAALKDA